MTLCVCLLQEAAADGSAARSGGAARAGRVSHVR